MNPLKLTEELAADIRARVKSLDFGAIEKIRKAKDDNGTFDVIISVEVLDRGGDIVKQDGLDDRNYKNNPIVLWGHDYYSLPIGVCTELYKTMYRGQPATGAKGVFYPSDINPMAQQVRKMYEFGVKSGYNVGCTTSIGFIPKEFDPQDGNIITKWEMLEFSFVPIPANQGVGPAEPRALTFDEAKELDLDVVGMRQKGLQFMEAEKAEDAEKKEAQAGDDCSMDDGSNGQLATDPNDADGPLVCIPKDNDKAKAAGRKPEKELIKALSDEDDRHTGEIEKALDEFQETTTAPADQSDEAKAAATEQTRESLKDLRDAVRDEHNMHRAKSVACLRAFEPENTAFDKKQHLKALREEHDGYEGKLAKALDEFEEKALKATGPDALDELVNTTTNHIETLSRAHKKSLTKIAKAMSRDAFGEEEQVDEQMVSILREYLAPHVDPQILSAIALKVGARISATTKERLREAHEHMKAASVIVEALHGNLGDGDGEEGRGENDGKSLTKVPEKQRSRPARAASAKDNELDAHLFAREILRGVTTAATAGLTEINEKLRANSNGRGNK